MVLYKYVLNTWISYTLGTFYFGGIPYVFISFSFSFVVCIYGAKITHSTPRRVICTTVYKNVKHYLVLLHTITRFALQSGRESSVGCEKPKRATLQFHLMLQILKLIRTTRATWQPPKPDKKIKKVQKTISKGDRQSSQEYAL